MAEYDFRSELLSVIPNLRAFAMSLVGAADKADDLVQETLVRAWDKRSSFTPGTNLKGWLFTILRNEFYSQMRKRKREVSDPEGAMAERMSSHPEQVGRLDMEDFKSAVNMLPEDQREALILVGASGFSYEEAADICDCAVGTIKSRVSRARTQLSKILKLEGDGEYGPDAVSVGVMNLNSPSAA
ncbi:sigma-70 family RNA polymerase sigma factor [Pelagibacterium montanilacus]|uniref:sigma-70 family RNA polymerase sigma factor n=1 Tax=Pelagibacterium montanilacus TaxID=2185280 RepID=UPI000F8F615A|nr:sigma-70 family RNA polymerase sigma factor [Pelagibacterium montanilacus]